MKYLNNKYIRIFISILLVLVISINFAYKPFAFALELGIAVKVFAVILGSMGILTVINNNGGVESFYEGFKDFMAVQKNITDTQLRLYQMGVTAIYNNAKMKVTNMANLIKEYYDITFHPKVIKVDIPDKQGVLKSFEGTFNKQKTIASDLNITSTTIELGEGYCMNSLIHYNNGYYRLMIRTYYNNVLIDAWSFTPEVYMAFASNVIIKWKVQITEEFIFGDAIISNIKSNVTGVIEGQKPITKLVGMELGNIGEVEDEYPTALPVPLGLTFPWERLESISGYFGDTVDNLIASISAVDIGTLVAELELLRRQGINTLPPAIIVGTPETVGEDGQISGDTVVEDIVVGEPTIGDFEAVEQTGLLTSALGVLGGILAFLKDIFSIPDDLELDIEPLKDLPLLTKFPFSLPWDYKNIITNFITDETKAPNFDIDFPIEVSAVNWSQDVKINVDFEQFTQLANIVRIMLSFIFVLGLIILTRTFIGGA